MNKLAKWIIPALLAILVLLPVSQVNEVSAASQYEDGEYKLPLEVLDASGSGTSTADQYIVSPAKLIVEDGKNKIQITIKESSMLKSLTVGSAAKTVSTDEANDTRVEQFEVADLDQVVSGKMHVVVPEMPGFPGYDKNHDVQFKFDTSGLSGSSGEKDSDANGASGENGDKDNNDGNGETDEDESGVVPSEDNPQTGDNAPILLFAVVLLASGLIFVRRVATK